MRHRTSKRRALRPGFKGVAVIMLIILAVAGVSRAGFVQASAPRTGYVAQAETPATTASQEQTQPAATQASEPQPTAAPQSTAPQTTTAPSTNQLTLPDTTAAEEGSTTEDTMDNTKELDAQGMADMKAIEGGTISPEQLAALKQLAADKIKDYGPIVLKKLDEKAIAKQEQRLVWIAILIIGIIPGLALIGFLLYPLITRKKIEARVPGVKLGQVYKLYLPQALLVTLILIGLGTALWGVQFLTGRVLGGVTNPQLVFQRQAINYIIDNRESLINDYTDLMVGLADDIAKADPEKPVMDIIIENALQLRDDPVVQTANNIIRFVMPFLNYISLISYGILLLFFLLRIRPDIMRLLTYPIDILEAEQKGQPLPDFDSNAVGAIHAASNTGLTMREIGRKLMWVEVKVVACFAIAVLAVAAIMSVVLVLFFSPIVDVLIVSLNEAVEYFLYVEGASGTLVTTSMILMVFLVECVVLFLFTFTFALGKLQDVLRQRFAGRITWKQTGTFMRKVGLRFGWIVVLLAVLGMGLPFASYKLNDVLYDKVQDANWTLLLLVIPISMLIGLNLGFWLLRGFKTMVRLITKSAAAEFGLKKPAAPKAELAAR